RGLFGAMPPDLSSVPVSKRLIIGSGLFGIGWGLGGFCPGPALANLGFLRQEAVVFAGTMLIGMIAAQKFFKVDT
ncbi:MAG: hypothetical protein O3C21_11630, partial [Verrucomicrobia bacterium]|nr:hypothetical protein [Verrucomicrobiota bacterium]